MSSRVYGLFCVSLGFALLSFVLLGLLLTVGVSRRPAIEFMLAGNGFGSPHSTQSLVQGEIVAGSLLVADQRAYPGGLTVGGALTVTGDLAVTHGLTVGRGLSVTGDLVVTGGLAVRVLGESLLLPGVRITSGLMVTDARSLQGGVEISGSLVVTDGGVLMVEGGLSVTGDVTVTGKLSVRPFRFYLPVVAQTIVAETDNGGFEEGPVMWHQYSSDGRPLIVPATEAGVPAHSGGWMARLGGADNDVSMLSQGVPIARDTSCLVFWQWTVSDDLCNADYGGVGVNGRWVNVSTLCAGTSTARWVRRQVSMTVYSVETMTTATVLNFAATNDYSAPSTMYIDDVAFYPTTLCTRVGGATFDGGPGSDDLPNLVGQPIYPSVANE